MRFFNKWREPEVIIQYAPLIDSAALFYVQNHPHTKKLGWHDWIPPNKEEINRRIKAYKEEWAKHNIVRDISKTLGLPFKRNVIDAYIVSGTLRATSRPIIISGTEKPKRFVVSLAHELIHRILTINKMPEVAYRKDESNKTNRHVIVYAVLKKILNEELWNIAATPKSKYPVKEYERARELVKEIGPDEVIHRMKAERSLGQKVCGVFL